MDVIFFQLGCCSFAQGCIYTSGAILSIFVVWPPIFVNTKEFPKYTQCYNILQEGPINLIPLSESCIFIAVSVDTHIGHI